MKAAVIDHVPAGPRLVRLASHPLAPGTIVEGEIVDRAAVVEAVEAVVVALGMRPTPVVTAVGGRDVIVKKISMDRVAASDAKEVILWEAEGYVPFDMQSVRLDFQILDPLGDGPYMDVLLVAAKTDVVERRLALLSEARLNATVIDVDAFALFNALEFNYPTATAGSAILVNLGHETTTIIAHENGVPIKTRDLSRSSGDAGEGWKDLGLAIERATAVLNAGPGGAGSFSSVHLSGGAARTPGLPESLAERLQARVEIVNPFQRLEVGPEAMLASPDEASAPMWMLPVGLALRAPGAG